MYLGGSELSRWAIVVLCSVILYGCASTETRQILDNGIVSSIQPGKTTKTEVETLLGKPSGIATVEVLGGQEEEEWSYYAIEEMIPGSQFAPTFLAPPVVKLAYAGAQIAMSFGTKFYGLSIRFSKEGTVKQVEKCRFTGVAHGKEKTCESY